MTERTKRPKTKPTWTDVKGRIAEFDRAGLQQLVSDLYTFHKDNQAFLHARFGLGENPFDAYKNRIAAALAPDISRKRHVTISVATAKKALSEYNKAIGYLPGLLELRLFWCETAVQFSMDYGYGDVGYLDALALQYSEACKALPTLDEVLLEDTSAVPGDRGGRFFEDKFRAAFPDAVSTIDNANKRRTFAVSLQIARASKYLISKPDGTDDVYLPVTGSIYFTNVMTGEVLFTLTRTEIKVTSLRHDASADGSDRIRALFRENFEELVEILTKDAQTKFKPAMISAVVKGEWNGLAILDGGLG